jgi:hypothetical protein
VSNQSAGLGDDVPICPFVVKATRDELFQGILSGWSHRSPVRPQAHPSPSINRLEIYSYQMLALVLSTFSITPGKV